MLTAIHISRDVFQALTCKLTGLEAYEKDQKVIERLVEIALGKTCIAAVDDRLDKVSLTLWDTSSEEDVNINETAAQVLKTEDLAPKLPVVGVAVDLGTFVEFGTTSIFLLYFCQFCLILLIPSCNIISRIFIVYKQCVLADF